MIKVTKGLDLPIQGQPAQEIEYGREVGSVALLGDDYIGMKPTMAVSEGDRVKLGQLLFTDKKTPGVDYTSPAAGVVREVNRGAKRKFLSVVIDVEGDEAEEFPSYEGRDLSAVEPKKVRENLRRSGMWPALRTRPYNKVPPPESTPHSIFVTAMDTSPLAADPQPIIAESRDFFLFGLQVLGRLTEGKVYVCHAPEADLPGRDLPFTQFEEFAGPHPAGLPGTHIHHLDPVNLQKTVWFLNYQDVIAYGKFFLTGRIPTERVVSLAGPVVKKPRLIRTRVGANLGQLVEGEFKEVENDVRVVSGSALSGRRAIEPIGYLGRYHLQVTALEEGNVRVLLGWQRPGMNKFSVTRAFASAIAGKGRKFPFNTSMEGSARAMVPIGVYEKVLAIDTVPTYFLRALIVGDTEEAQALGALEMDEDDIALCTFVCPGKYDYGPLLRENLRTIELEG